MTAKPDYADFAKRLEEAGCSDLEIAETLRAQAILEQRRRQIAQGEIAKISEIRIKIREAA